MTLSSCTGFLYFCYFSVTLVMQDSGISLWPTFAEQLVNCVLHSDPGVRQAAAYGIILVLQRLLFSFAALCLLLLCFS